MLLVDELHPLATALNIARRTRTIALQCAFIGLELSIVGMIVAAFGYLAALCCKRQSMWPSYSMPWGDIRCLGGAK